MTKVIEKKEFLPYAEAQAIVAQKNFKKVEEFRMWKDRPANIPFNPNEFYFKRGWNGWENWLGIRRLSKFVSYEAAKAWAKKNCINTNIEWKKLRPKYMPKFPDLTYKGKGWVNWYEFLGKTSIGQFLPFEKAREIIRAMKLKSYTEFLQLKNRPKNIPSCPNITYKDKGWVDGYDWVGIPKTRNYKEFLPYEEAERVVQELKLKTILEFQASVKALKGIPFRPDYYYKDKGWIGWGKFLGRDKH